ncbi:MAG: response regulator transcription factor, partial [Microbacterium sp.]
GIVVTDDFGDAIAAIAAIAAEPPDVVLMDLHLPGIGGVEATRRLTSAGTSARVLVLSMHDDGPTVLSALGAGARGYVTKSSPLDEIVRAIHAVNDGQLLVGGDVSAHVLRGATSPSAAQGQAASVFTLRERQLLPLLADGVATERMAARLGIAEKTVRNYLSAVYLKLGAEDRTTAALAARKLLDGR